MAVILTPNLILSGVTRYPFLKALHLPTGTRQVVLYCYFLFCEKFVEIM